jgi:hypothetical protein
MRIERTDLAMAAYHERTRTQVTRTSMTAWVDRPARPDPTSAPPSARPAVAASCPADGPASVDGTDPATTDPKLAALIDHYYAASTELRALLERRDRELAELRRRLDERPVRLSR